LNTGIAALLYIGGIMVIGVAAVYAYVVITGDETGEKLQPLARKGNPLYPIFGPAPSDPSKFGSNNNTNTSGNYTLPKVSIPTSRNNNQVQSQPQPGSGLPPGFWYGTSAASAKAAYYMYDKMSAEEERYEQPWALQH
jgi:hypothetical protein